MEDDDYQKTYIGYIDRMLETAAWGNDHILTLLKLSVGRVLIKKGRLPNEPTLDQHYELVRVLRHIRDWLVVAVADNAKWLSNVDDLGQPKKLIKFSSLEAISLEADRQMARKQRQAPKVVALIDGDERFFFDAGEGWTIVQLLTPIALDRESELMQHCIGQGAYDEALTSNCVAFLSLRDPLGKPHVTCEVREGKLVQFQGKQNKPPIEQYVLRWLPYLNAEKIDCSGSEQFITDVNGVVYSVYNLPEFLSVDGPVVLKNNSDRPLRLPRTIHVTYSLHILGNAFLNTPEEIRVGNVLYVEGTALSTLPQSLSVGWSLTLEGMNDLVLPSKLHIKGDLSLFGSSIAALPDGLFVGGTLNIAGTNLSELPSDLRCGGINISKTRISCFDTKLFYLDPNGFRVPRNLLAFDSALETIVGLPHFSDLVVGSPKFETPDGLVVEGILRIVGGKAKIRKSTKSVRRLLISNSEVDIELEKVSHNVTVRNSTVSFGKTLRCAGIVEISNGTKIERLPNQIKCLNILLVASTIPSWPAEMIASESVKIFETGSSRLDAVIKTKDLWVSEATEFIGEGIRAKYLTVCNNLPLWKMDFASVKAYLNDGGDLHIQPEGATSLHGSLARQNSVALGSQ